MPGLQTRLQWPAPERFTMSICRVVSLLATLAAFGLADPSPISAAEGSVRLQGATTFAAEIIEPNVRSIERAAGRSLDMVANKSIWGLFALLEGRCDLAMISAPLAAEIISARALKPDLPYEKLQEFHVATTRIAFAAHPSNPISHLPIPTLGRILRGEITNWKELGGADLPIRVVAVKEGGGTVAATRAALLGDAPLAADAVRLESAKHVLKVVAQEPGAIGISQLGLIRQSGLLEIATDQMIGQPLSFVTLGAPRPELTRVIDATRTAVAYAHH
jgi:phosphate transport system substrate-binding protein